MSNKNLLISIRVLIKKLIQNFGITGRKLFYPGIGIGRYVLSIVSNTDIKLEKSLLKNNQLAFLLKNIRSKSATLYLCNWLNSRKGETLKALDIGAGQLTHSKIFRFFGARVTAVDFFIANTFDGVEIFKGNFMEMKVSSNFDLVFCSHVLEHQLNVHLFLKKVISFAKKDGIVCITVPDAHRHLEGGHLTLWTPGLLAYNIILCGFDLSDSKLIIEDKQFSIIFNPKETALPSLNFDTGDIDRLAQYFPPGYKELTDGWKSW